jgi:hypothetical protein
LPKRTCFSAEAKSGPNKSAFRRPPARVGRTLLSVAFDLDLPQRRPTAFLRLSSRAKRGTMVSLTPDEARLTPLEPRPRSVGEAGPLSNDHEEAAPSVAVFDGCTADLDARLCVRMCVPSSHPINSAREESDRLPLAKIPPRRWDCRGDSGSEFCRALRRLPG